MFRPYWTHDVLGVALGGAVKNVLAIATGIADGLGLGLNARAALITRGLAEMSRLGVTLGGRAETFTGLTGLGDLIRISKMNLRPVREPGRTQRDLPAANSRFVDRQWEEQVGFSDHVVIEEVGGASVERVRVERPSAEGDGDAELMFFIPFAGEGCKATVAAITKIDQ